MMITRSWPLRSLWPHSQLMRIESCLAATWPQPRKNLRRHPDGGVPGTLNVAGVSRPPLLLPALTIEVARTSPATTLRSQGGRNRRDLI
jgi:hypothetical protein